MLDLDATLALARKSFPYTEGAFYGSAQQLGVGVGLIYDRIRYPLFNETTRLFSTVEGLVYVLTHECDVDPANARQFNEYVLVCPIIALDVFATEFAQSRSEAALAQFIPDLAGDRIFRVTFLPPISTTAIPFGGILYLNQICSTHRELFASAPAQSICALSSYAQSILDMKLLNHLFRPKSDVLPRLR
jgi:hypothetical protein